MNSIKKGKAFELNVAHLLTELTGKTWHRVPQSGAGATAQKIKDANFRGDVFCEEEPFSGWCVECKITGKKIMLHDLFNENSLLAAWWLQTLKEAGNKKPVLIFKYSFSPIFLISQEALEGCPALRGGQNLHFFIKEDTEAVVRFGCLNGHG